jgi:protein phosphatase
VAGDRFLLCSDGLFRELSDDQIAAVLRRFAEPGEAAKELVTEAKFRGGNDNVTVIVVDAVDPATTLDATHALAVDEAGHSEEASDPDQSGYTDEVDRAGDGLRARATRPRRRMITLRVVLFSLGLLALVVLAAGGVAWYARTSYFVGLSGDRIVIYQGRPGGVLWFRPTVADATAVTTADVLPRHLPALSAGQQEPSLSAARQFVSSMVNEKRSTDPARPAPTTTLPPRPRSTTPSTR